MDNLIRYLSSSWISAAAALFLSLSLISEPALAAKRLAFVVGNSNYPEWPLVNPVNDARAVSAKLNELGFDVTTKLQLKRDDVGYSTEQFLAKVSPGDVVVFFFAGHGVQVGGRNYLLATDAKIRGSFDVPLNSIDVDRFLSRLDATRAAVKLVFLDACRNNPFEGMFRGGASRGLARIGSAPFGTLISFATQPGGVAADGEGKNGLYTSQLIKHLDSPGLPVEQMLKRVAIGAFQKSGGKQQPWMEGSLHGNFVFRPEVPAPPKVKPATLASDRPVTPSVDEMAWQYALEINQRRGYDAFLREYPDSRFAGLARMRLATLTESQTNLPEADQKPTPIDSGKKVAAIRSTRNNSNPPKDPFSARPKPGPVALEIGKKYISRSRGLRLEATWNGKALVIDIFQYRSGRSMRTVNCGGLFKRNEIPLSSERMIDLTCASHSNLKGASNQFDVPVRIVGKFPEFDLFEFKDVLQKGLKFVAVN